MRDRYARAPDEGVRLANTIRSRILEARVRRKVPGLFVFVAPDFARERMRSRLLFYNLDVAKKPPPRVQRADRPRGGDGGNEFISL